ncbi:MAG TPA: diphosphomevalonate decarboxylase [Candidatus Ligilactobacillus excrementigallinarum]|uniref:diphosphomevalonate decarboxylase n=1 Tax=Candidatus Ligilactobacillus excrementigallinarum TaxID=2838641 RepID=A0A9D1UX32_9LACO|nr:diphosphomevalonate decarboxylase [Candidatus Ligilactobacillus excrementigallinarum]
MTNLRVTARAHTNIALVKYWGKADTDLIIPQNGSLSLTLDHFYTDTTVEFDSKLTTDQFILDGESKSPVKITNFLNIVRQKAGINSFAKVDSVNHVPSTAGLASSASAYAALAAAASKASGLNLSHKELSKLARRGSGSASRSIYGGFVEWIKGYNDDTSYAVPIEEDLDWKIGMIVAMVNSDKKKISSRTGMQTVVNTSPFYSAWVESIDDDLRNIKVAIKNRDFKTMGEIAESNAMRMHALNLSSSPHFNYFEPLSIEIMDTVEDIRTNEQIECYYTVDAGPNIKILCQQKDADDLLSKLRVRFPQIQFSFTKPGPGIKYLN